MPVHVHTHVHVHRLRMYTHVQVHVHKLCLYQFSCYIGFVDMCVQHIPSPVKAAKTKVKEFLFHDSASNSLSLSLLVHACPYRLSTLTPALWMMNWLKPCCHVTQR